MMLNVGDSLGNFSLYSLNLCTTIFLSHSRAIVAFAYRSGVSFFPAQLIQSQTIPIPISLFMHKNMSSSNENNDNDSMISSTLPSFRSFLT